MASTSPIKTAAVFGATGNFGRPITHALLAASFDVIIFSRPDSTSDTSSFVSPGTNVPVPVLRVPYTVDALAPLFASRGVDAVVCALGPGAAAGGAQQAMLDAAVAPGSRVRRFVLNEFAWHEEFRGIDDLKAFGEPRRRDREYVRALEGKGEVEGGFSWSGVAVGNPIDWALRRFPLAMGVDASTRTALILDSGTEPFTGTTLAGIGQAVVGTLANLEGTRNRLLRVRSVRTCQNELLAAFQAATATGPADWTVKHDTAAGRLAEGRRKRDAGEGGWVLDLVTAQMLEEGAGRSLVADTAEESDNALVGVVEEDLEDIVTQVLRESEESRKVETEKAQAKLDASVKEMAAEGE